MFEITNLTRRFNGDHAVNDVSLSIPEGARVAVLGPSGSGKTTLLHMMGGVVEPDSGQVSIYGRDLAGIPPGKERAELVGIMHQQFDLVDELPVVQNVLAGRLGSWGIGKSLLSLIWPMDEPAARQALERVGIADKMYEKTRHLSGGEQQRVALARILIQHPEAILADEPVSSVDPARARDILELLFRIANEEDLTLVTSLHSMELALEFFPRVIGLRQGRVFFDDSPSNITRDQLDQLYELP
jgi:phosphonate transport system ATP-binding protein